MPLAGQRGRSKGLAQGVRVPAHGPNGGAADSLDEAKAAFRAARAVKLMLLFMLRYSSCVSRFPAPNVE
jgi:hypothetical protein